jgi:hypothetical protein
MLMELLSKAATVAMLSFVAVLLAALRVCLFRPKHFCSSPQTVLMTIRQIRGGVSQSLQVPVSGFYLLAADEVREAIVEQAPFVGMTKPGARLPAGF